MVARMWVSIRARIFKFNRVLHTRYFSTEPLPEYPPILDTSVRAKWTRRQNSLYDNIRLLPTVEEKLLECTKPRFNKEYDELFAISLTALPYRYNTLRLRQHITRTRLIRELPQQFTHDFSTKFDDIYNLIKPSLVDALLLCASVDATPKWVEKPKIEVEQRIKTNFIIDTIFRQLRLRLAQDFDHLRDCQVDVDARVEAFWYAGGFSPNDFVRKRRKKIMRFIPEDEPTDISFCYDADPRLQIRTELPLPPVVPRTDVLCQATPSDPAPYPYHPQALGLNFKWLYPTLLPGFWPGDFYEYGHTSVHTRELIHKRRSLIGVRNEEECILECGLMASFGWLMGIAAMQGFDPFNEITHPFTTQTIVTDGQHWSFFIYQLNTTSLKGDISSNPTCNLCWSSKDMKLYDVIEDGKIKGLNDDVFKMLIRFLTTTPVNDKFLTEKPYLRARECDDKTWKKITATLQDMYAQRPSRKRKRRPTDWEKIYLFRNAYTSINPLRRRF